MTEKEHLLAYFDWQVMYIALHKETHGVQIHSTLTCPLFAGDSSTVPIAARVTCVIEWRTRNTLSSHITHSRVLHLLRRAIAIYTPFKV